MSNLYIIDIGNNSGKNWSYIITYKSSDGTGAIAKDAVAVDNNNHEQIPVRDDRTIRTLEIQIEPDVGQYNIPSSLI